MIPLTEEITYWLPAANDGTSGITWDAGVKISARIAYKSDVVINEDGKQVGTRYMVYSETQVPEKAFIYLGDANGDPSPHAEARQVVAVSSVPSMTTLNRMMI